MPDCEALSISLPDQLFLSLLHSPPFEGMLCLDYSNPRDPHKAGIHYSTFQIWTDF